MTNHVRDLLVLIADLTEGRISFEELLEQLHRSPSLHEMTVEDAERLAEYLTAADSTDNTTPMVFATIFSLFAEEMAKRRGYGHAPAQTLNRALERVFEREARPVDVARCRLFRALGALSSKQYESAKQYAGEARTVFERTQATYEVACCELVEAECFAALGEGTKAKEHIERARPIFAREADARSLASCETISRRAGNL